MSISISPRELEHARDDAIQALGIHFANDDLSIEELDQRLTLAYQASSRDQLAELLSDLPILPEYGTGTSGIAPTQVVTTGNVPERGVVAAVMGGTSRSGAWLVPRQLKAVAIMGGVELDFRQARFAPGITEIDVYAAMGGVDIIVPHGVRVEVLGVAIMGGFEASAGDFGSSDPDQPVIHLSGLAFMGGVDARHKKPSTKALARFEKRLNEVRRRIRGER